MKTLPSVLLALLLLSLGCTSHKRAAYMQDKAAKHVYNIPLPQLWPEVRGLLVSKGYALREVPGGHEIVTEWLQMTASSSLGVAYQRYLVRGRKLGPELSSLQFFKMVRTESEVTMQGNQDLVDDRELAWEFLQRIDAAAAKKYEEEALQQYP